MDFNDRRPGNGQLSLFGGEVTAHKSQDPARGYKALGSGARRDHPVGMRGSMPERAGVPIREKKLWQNRAALTSLRNRARDESSEEPGRVLSTHDDVGMKMGSSPGWANFHSSASSSRERHGEYREVPIQDANGPSLHTPQWTVSAGRVKEQMEHPETRSNPRLGHEELPHVYHDPFLGTHTVIDGNHRMTGALMRNEMFQPAKVLEPKHQQAVRADTVRLFNARQRADRNPRANPDWEEEVASRWYDS